MQVGAASRGWNQTGAEGPRGGRATWVGGGRPLASQCDEGLSTGGADHVLLARTSTASLRLKSSILGLNVRKQRGFCLYIDSDLYIFNAFVPEQRGAYPRKAELRQHTVFPQEYANV